MEKNTNYKQRIEDMEKEIMVLTTKGEELEVGNEFLIKKKEEVVNERKKFIALNEELKREIEQKNQLNDMRIQKKVKENNSEEIQNLEEHLTNVIATIDDLEKKIVVEQEKSKHFESEIIRLTINLKHQTEKREKVIESVDNKIKEMDELKGETEELRSKYTELKDRVYSNFTLSL